MTDGIWRFVPVLAITVHVVVVGWSVFETSATVNEAAHLAAGLATLENGRTDIYRVNPPIARTLAAAGTSRFNPALPPLPGPVIASDRPEWMFAQNFMYANGPAVIDLFRWGRLTLLPFTCLGAVITFLWAKDLSGPKAGLIACVLWCFSPNIIAHASLITPDLTVTSLFLTSCYFLKNWLQRAAIESALACGLFLGLALVAKFSALLLLIIFPVCWGLSCFLSRQHKQRPIQGLFQLCSIILIAIWIVNVTFAFKGTLQPLGQYSFISETFSGEILDAGATANRFHDSILGFLPVPVPEQYLLGLDQQLQDVQAPWSCYLDGEWQTGGWSSFYARAFFYKVPEGTLLLLGVTAACWLSGIRLTLVDTLLLVLPASTLFLAVSLKTTMTIHFRYILPCLPFIYILIAATISSITLRWCRLLVHACLTATVVSSLSQCPHSLAYFNKLSGGPAAGHHHLLDSNLDWGQDTIRLADWYLENPHLRPLFVRITMGIDPRILGIEAQEIPLDPHCGSGFPGSRGPVRPGWYAISANYLFNRRSTYHYLQRMDRVGFIGRSIHLFYVSPDDANRVNRDTDNSVPTKRTAFSSD